MWEPETCKVLCRLIIDAKSAKEIKEKIYYQYRVNMILDDLPLVFPTRLVDNEDSPNSYHLELGFPVGLRGWYATVNITEEEVYFIYNHLAFTVNYHRDLEMDSARIVGFEVKPFSIKHGYKGKWYENTRLITCGKERASYLEGPQEVEEEKEIIFTYDVQFQEIHVKWSSRWDAYLLTRHRKTQWLSIISSLTIVLLLSGGVAMLMRRALYCDIAKYDELESEEEGVEKTGWKLIHGDVFRPPSNSDLLCVYVGSGVQIFGTVLAILIHGIFGILSPPNRGFLVTAVLIVWVLMGLFAGYASSHVHKMFKGTRWKIIALETAFMSPVIVFAIVLVLNYLLWSQNSSRAVPFGKMFGLAFMLLGISVSLVFVGSFFGFKKPVMEDPVKTCSIPRQIPKRAWYMNPVFSILIGGILPFGAVFNELFFILASICLNQLIYIYGFLFLVFVILLIVCSEITIVFCYFHLCREDWQWWWRSYLTSGSSALYIFLYSTYFFMLLDITGPVSVMIYFGYVLIATYAFFVMTGTIGFYACFWFTRLIYSSVKID
ncbi:hypothetical protein DITRI_Ditri10aG0137300 [Diplodiscus trichospermus]